MKKMLLAAAAIGVALTATTADARQRCGAYGHRDYYGRCVPNRGPGPGPERVVVAPGLAIGSFYNGRGYWDGQRYWHERYREGHEWRYRDHDRRGWRHRH